MTTSFLWRNDEVPSSSRVAFFIFSAKPFITIRVWVALPALDIANRRYKRKGTYQK